VRNLHRGAFSPVVLKRRETPYALLIVNPKMFNRPGIKSIDKFQGHDYFAAGSHKALTEFPRCSVSSNSLTSVGKSSRLISCNKVATNIRRWGLSSITRDLKSYLAHERRTSDTIV
jgi:hypothetical protein